MIMIIARVTGKPGNVTNNHMFLVFVGRGEAGGAMACAGCEKPILDKFLLHVLERAWHAACVRCADCRAPLADKCYSRDNKLFCRNDFFR